jgi:uncharacterized protein (DUF2235 family)
MPKTLIVCCDGTWNKPDQGGGPTNVTKMARAILPRAANGDPQLVYYDEGVGTGNAIDRVVGGGLGIGLGTNVQQAYRFLALNYEPGDRLLMFGFSRGAYTVRSLAGLVGLVGLLRKGDLDQMPKVWDYYRTPPEQRQKDYIQPDWVAARDPGIDLVGVWDTVGALGIPGNFLGRIGRRRHEFHDVKLGKKVRHAFHALAIDERRKSFDAAVWDTNAIGPDQIVEQVWFAGAHSNVGGGYPDAELSDQSFLWMINKARPLLDFDEDYISRRVRVMKEEEARGLLVDSSAGWWKALGRIWRVIGEDRSESVHPSALARLRNSGKEPRTYEPHPYQPENLVAYLKKKGISI